MIRKHRFVIAAAVLAALTASACSSSSGKSASTPASASGGSSAGCSGRPLTFTEIDAFTGPLSVPARKTDEPNGLKAALHAVNQACTAGRPLAVVNCDDRSDANQSTQCGREAKSNGSIAIFGNSGSSDNGVQAAALPGVMLTGTGQWDLTSPKAFASTNVVMEIVGISSAAAGARKKNLVIVAAQTPSLQFAVQVAVAHAKSLGMKAEPLYFPPDTTDFTSIAAQVAGMHADAIGVVTPPLPLYTALAAQGITPKNSAFFSDIVLYPVNVINTLPAKGDGTYLISPDRPAQESSTAGIRQMKKEWEAAGISEPFDEAGTFAVTAWSKVHSLATILGKLPRTEVASLTPDKLVAAMTKAGPVTPLVSAPFDFSNPKALPSIPQLASLRIFTNQILVTQLEGGQYRGISDFSSIASAIPLQAK